MVCLSSGRLTTLSVAVLLVLGGGTFAGADATPVDVELVLAVDVSRSMDVDEQRLQREGYIAAFRHREVLDAIVSGIYGRIAVTYVEWAGAELQKVVVPWTVVDSPAKAELFARRLEAPPLGRLRRTSISGAVSFATRLLEGNGYEGLRRVIDVSGDGPNNAGVPVASARDAAVAAGIVINGLPILIKPRQRAGFFDIDHLDMYFEDCVIGGPGAFTVPVADRTELATAIRRKLVLEIAGRAPHLIPASAGEPAPRMDCLIGEKLWELRRRYLE
ncbi:MAG: DUF1194 domain-containing protein [Alphaproteobacteria bacterium]